MTVNRGPGVAPIAGVGTTTVEHRLQLAGLYAENAPGVPRSGVLGQATDQLVIGKADMSYDVSPAALVISRTAAEGVYTPTLTGTTNVATGAAPGTNSRWDLIYVKQNDQAKGDADNDAVIGVQQGTAGASPTKPTGSLPAGAYVIAEARIFAGTTGTSGGSNTITQVWRHTAARGAAFTIRNSTERAEITSPAQGQEIDRRDTGRREKWNGTRWALAAATELGHSLAGSSGAIAQTPSWTDLHTVTGTTQGGEVAISYAIALANGNSGAHRDAAVRITCDGGEIDGWTFTIPYIAGIQVPFNPSLLVEHTPTAGSHTWKIQGNASAAGAVVVLKGSVAVTEKP
ncbi:hypothetical protein [Arthrobacter sp. HS15c]|uniref:hypothetical protein n=1 Tax=Arthrobacter sp. HS15c TaxID=3230279 RepID=UPI003467895B